jgi:hypothetical protein
VPGEAREAAQEFPAQTQMRWWERSYAVQWYTSGIVYNGHAVLISSTATRSGALRSESATPARQENGRGDARPALVAMRLIESSASPCERTGPHSAMFVPVWSARPFSSTSATANWTDAWSLDVIRRSVHAVSHLAHVSTGGRGAHWSRSTCAGRRGRRAGPARTRSAFAFHARGDRRSDLVVLHAGERRCEKLGSEGEEEEEKDWLGFRVTCPSHFLLSFVRSFFVSTTWERYYATSSQGA